MTPHPTPASRAARWLLHPAQAVWGALRHPRSIDGPSRLIIWAMVFAATFYIVPAASADTASVNNTLAMFNGKDSHGINLSQFQMSIDMGGVTNAALMPVALMIQGTWTCYVWWIGLIGWMADWTMQMDWVPYIVGPVADVSQRLHDSILSPLGLTSLAGQGIMGVLLTVAAWIGYHRANTTGVASGMMSWLQSGTAAALAVGFFALPVATLAGTNSGLAQPLVYSRGLSIQIAAEIEGKTVDLGDPNIDVLTPGKPIPKPDKTIHVLQQVPDDLKISTMLIDTLVRPAHQAINYGADIDSDKCGDGKPAADAYDAALKAGPYTDMSDDSERSAMGDCKDAYKDYADNPNFTWLATAVLYSLAALLLGGVVLWFIYIVCRSVISLVWGALKTTFQSLAAIASPTAWSGLTHSLLECAAALWMVITNLVMFCIVMMACRGVLTKKDIDLTLRFFLVDMMLVMGIGLLTLNYVQTRRGAQSLAQRLSQRFTGKERSKLDWGQIGRDATLGYTALAELNEKRAVMRGDASPRSVEGDSTRSRPSDVAAAKAGVATRKVKSVAGTAVAATGGVAGVAVETTAHATRKQMSKVASTYGDAIKGGEVRGLGKATLPVAKTHNALRSRKNQLLNTTSAKAEAASEQRLASRAGATRPAASSTGSQKIDKLASTIGSTQRKLDTSVAAAHGVVTSTRYGARHADTTGGTGKPVVDTALKGVGSALKGADKAKEVYERPASITPATPRVNRTDLRQAEPIAEARRATAGATRAATNPTGGVVGTGPRPRGRRPDLRAHRSPDTEAVPTMSGSDR